MIRGIERGGVTGQIDHHIGPILFQKGVKYESDGYHCTGETGI